MAWTSWYTSFSDAFKKRAGRYLINKYLGTFLDETVSLDQLSVDGAISLNNVALNIRTINSLIDSADLPVEFVDGYISHLSVTIPWANLLTESCYFSISGLTVTVQVKKRANPAQISASIFHSMCESFSSFTLADECMKAEDVTASPGKSRTRNNEEDVVAGVELLAQAIDSVIMRVQVKLLDTTVRLEYMPGLDHRGIALELQIGKIIYKGETGNGEEQFSVSTVRKVFLEDINLLTDEFSLSSHSPMSSLHTSRYSNRSPNAERRDSVGSVGSSGTVNENENNENCDNKPDIDPPLMLASLKGNQELIMRFTEMNQFGLPRAVDEIEIGFSHLKFHIYPHQVHILTEIAAAVTVPAKPVAKPSKHQRNLMVGLEGLIQENLRQGYGQQGLNVGWADRDLEASREFMPAISRSQGFLSDDRHQKDDKADSQSPPMPRIKIRAASCVGILHMMDPGIIKLGGEPTRFLAMMSMRQSAENFFSNSSLSSPVWDNRKLSSWHKSLGQTIGSSHLQILAAPVNVVYEEGTSIGPGLTSSYAAMTTVILGKVSLVEYLVDNCDKTQPQLISLLKFSHNEAAPMKKTPDVKLQYKDSYEQGDLTPVSTLTLNINSCSLDVDPGVVDRTYLLLNYADLDPDCVKTISNATNTSDTQTSLSVTISSPNVDIVFHVPKPDMRHPHDIGQEFIGSFWTRKVHPELFNFQLADFCLKISQTGGPLAPLHVNLSSTSVEISYQECEAVTPFQLVQARRMMEKTDRTKKSYAVEVDITVCMDDSLKLQGKFNSKLQKMQKSFVKRKGSGSPDEREYFVVDPESNFGQEPGTRPGFLQQQDDILAALRQAALKNNLLINIRIDAVSLVIPSKQLYEVIYNRLGNDLLLWLPQYFAVKQHIFGEKLIDPLHDDTHEFSGCFSGRPEAIEVEAQERPKHTTAFPKDRQPGALEIHTDTAVLLSCNQVQLLVCLSLDYHESMLGLLHVSALGVNLTVAAGLDKDPEISLLTLNVSEGCIKHGLIAKNSLPDQLHFNPNLSGLSVLVTTNSYCDRAWPHKLESDALLRMTAKILLDSVNNLKSIQLAFQIVQMGLCVAEPSEGQDWINAIADFFTVQEFPVLGYNPPAVLTEMHLRLEQCAVELAPLQSPVRAAVCLGKVGISCSLLDSTQDASVTLSLEDTGIYLSKDSVSPTSSSVCVTDIDYLDLTINLSEPELSKFDSEEFKRPEPTLLVSAALNLIRIRTCADTLQILGELISSISPPVASTSTENLDTTESTEESVSDVTIGQKSEDILPDLEDAMEELINEKENNKPAQVKSVPSRGQGAQVYFTPHENNSSREKPSLPTDLMTQSIYFPPPVQDEEEDSSDLDSFCILEDEEGSGIMPSGGGPAVKSLVDGNIKLVDNHFNIPEAVTDHLKAPRGFPQPQMKLSLTRMNIQWQIFGGNDFSSSMEMKHNCKAKLEKAGISFTSDASRAKRRMDMNTGISSAVAAADSLKLRGGPGRNNELLIEIIVNKMAAQHDVYPETGVVNAPVTRQILIVPNLEIRDKLGGSEINKMLHMYSSKTRPRQSSANMLHIKCLTIKPEPTNPCEETSLKVSLQPLRLNIDQDTLFFIIDFVNTLMPQNSEDNGKSPSPAPSSTDSGQSIKFSSGMQAIQIEVPEGAEIFEDARSSPPKSPPNEDDNEVHEVRSKSSTPAPYPSSSSTSSSNMYFKSFVFSPSVPIRIDYVGKYVDLTQGALTGILAGLAQLNCSELTLKQLELKQGILGVDKLLVTAANAWLADIRSSQLPALLGGVGPMHAFLQMVYGIRDLVLLPLEQYKKDGRIVRGLQKGTTSFTHSTTLSFLDVTNKFLNVVKFVAELAFDVMSPDGCVVYGKLPHPVRDCKRKAGRAIVRRARGTPADLREGMLGAVQLLREGFDETARSLLEAAAAGGGDRQGMAGAVGGVLRAVPSTMVRPVILGAAATSNLLDGVKNQISPDQRVEEEEKWKTYS